MNNIKFYYLILDKLQEFIFILNDFNLKKLFNKWIKNKILINI